MRHAQHISWLIMAGALSACAEMPYYDNGYYHNNNRGYDNNAWYDDDSHYQPYPHYTSPPSQRPHYNSQPNYQQPHYSSPPAREPQMRPYEPGRYSPDSRKPRIEDIDRSHKPVVPAQPEQRYTPPARPVEPLRDEHEYQVTPNRPSRSRSIEEQIKGTASERDLR